MDLVTSSSNEIAKQHEKFDPRSESNIITLAPKAQIEARNFLSLMKKHNKNVKILSGTRTYDEQNVLYNQGRFGNAGKIVTNAKGGQSNHNFGAAWDIGFFNTDGSYSSKNADYTAIANLALPELPNLEWGGNWTSIKDTPHYQLKAVGDDVAAIREKFENGAAIV